MRLRTALLAFLAVCLSYQWAVPVDLPATSLISDWTYRDFYGPEEGYRWSRGVSAIRVPDPGFAEKARIELTLSGWRPRGKDSPAVHIQTRSATVTASSSREETVVSVDSPTRGLWDTTSEVRLQSDVFTPGADDPRTLGVRVSSLRFVPEGPSFALRPPPLREALLSALLVLLLGPLLGRLGVIEPLASRTSEASVIVVGLAFVLARAWAVLAVVPVVAVFVCLHALFLLAPGPASTIVRRFQDGSIHFASGLGRLHAVPTLALAALGTLAVSAAYWARPALEIDVGSGREAEIARGFGPYQGASGITFREPGRGAALDLRDFGGGSDWKITIAASRPSHPGDVRLASAAEDTLTSSLGAGWSESTFTAHPHGTWRSGLVLDFPGTSGVRIDKVLVERGRSHPSLRLLALALIGALFAGAAVGTLELGSAFVHGAFGAVFLGIALALYRDPVVVLPFVLTAVFVMLLAWILAATLTTLLRSVASEIRGAACLGFAAWLLATAYPLYRGGHFVFHSSIAEEIWKGRFLIYYLPFPGSMLSRQAQWGDIVVPHPCLYHTVVSPLAALPHGAFYFAEKCVLALMLAGLTVMAGVLARDCGETAGTFASVAAAALVPTFQLLGLGHLMTIFGVFAMGAAMTTLIRRFPTLEGRRGVGVLAGLLAVCFLSYLAALLFTLCVIAWSVPFLVRTFPTQTRRLVQALLLGCVAAFLLYYVNWTWPFLRESIPRVLHGGHSGHPVPLAARLALMPEKVHYSYGSLVIPLLGFAGLLFAMPKGPERVFLRAWACILPAFGVVDLFFNLLLKHHYFTMTPIAVGLGILLSTISRRAPWGKPLAGLILLWILGLGFQEALTIAVGGVP